jgi:hypothetical protein
MDEYQTNERKNMNRASSYIQYFLVAMVLAFSALMYIFIDDMRLDLVILAAVVIVGLPHLVANIISKIYCLLRRTASKSHVQKSSLAAINLAVSASILVFIISVALPVEG